MDANQRGSSKVAQMIWIAVTPIIFAVGVFGNIVTIIVLSRRHNRNTSTAIYLVILAWTDLMLLIFVLPRWWLIYTFGFDVRHISNVVCKLHWFVSYFTTLLSPSLLLIVTVERIISTTKPYKVKFWCKKKIALRVSALTAFVLCCIISHVLYGFNLERVEASGGDGVNITAELSVSQAPPVDTGIEAVYTCLWTHESSYSYFYTTVFQWMVVVIYSIAPQAVFFLGGIVIVRTLARSRHLRGSTDSGKLRNHSNQITITLLTVNAVFFLCTTPVQIFMSGRKYWIDLEKGMTEIQEILWAIFNMLFFLNHAINFVLYFLSGMKFRSEVTDLFRRCVRSKEREVSASSVPSISEHGRQEDSCYFGTMEFSNELTADVD